MSGCSLVEWLTLFVLLGTGGVIAWYTWETRRLRQEAQRQVAESQLQTELQNRPFLSLTIAHGAPMVTADGGTDAVKIVNLGKGLARTIAVEAHSGETFELRMQQPIPHIAPASEATGKWRVFARAAAGERRTEVPSKESGPMVKNLLTGGQPFDVALTYMSIVGQRYRTTLRIEEGVVEIADDARMGDLR